MESAKIIHMAKIEGEELIVYETQIPVEAKHALTRIESLIERMGGNFEDIPSVRFSINIYIGEGSSKRRVALTGKVPHFTHLLEPNKVENFFDFYASLYLPIDIFDGSIGKDLNSDAGAEWGETEQTRCIWCMEDNLFWSTRPYRSSNDCNFIKLKVEEYALEKKDEYSRLKRKVERLQQISSGSVKGSRAKIPDDVVAFVFSRDSEQCVACSSKKELQIDHVIPVSWGGGDSVENLQILCKTCNQKRGNLGNQ